MKQPCDKLVIYSERTTPSPSDSGGRLQHSPVNLHAGEAVMENGWMEGRIRETFHLVRQVKACERILKRRTAADAFNVL